MVFSQRHLCLLVVAWLLFVAAVGAEDYEPWSQWRTAFDLGDECLLGCFTGEGRVAAGMWSEATCPYSANHLGSNEDDRYYQCAEHRHAD